jgi:hypothetical protein
MSFEELTVDVVSETPVESVRTQQEAIVERSVEEIDRGVDIEVPAERAFRNGCLHDLADACTSRIQPALPECNRELGIGLSFGYEGADEVPAGTSKEGYLQFKLPPEAFDCTARLRKVGLGSDENQERIHDQGGLVGPVAVDRHFPHTSFGGDLVYTDGPKAPLCHHLQSGLEHGIVCSLASRSPDLAHSEFL